MTNKYDQLQKYYEECLRKQFTNFKCNECEEEFEYKHNLQKHKTDVHIKNGTYKCEVCDLQFSEKWKFDGHLKTCKKNSCDQCDRIFRSNIILNKHKEIAHDKIKILLLLFQ